MLRKLMITFLLALAPTVTQATPSLTTVALSHDLTAPKLAQTGYDTVSAHQDFPINSKDMSEWIYGGFKVLVARQSSEYFETPVDVIPLSGKWPETGSIRRVELADGHYANEQAILAQPNYFRYVIWDMSRPSLGGLDYVVAEYRLTSLPSGGSRFSWDYHVMKNDQYMTAGTAEVMELGVVPMMEDTLNSLYYLAKSHFEFDD